MNPVLEEKLSQLGKDTQKIIVREDEKMGIPLNEFTKEDKKDSMANSPKRNPEKIEKITNSPKREAEDSKKEKIKIEESSKNKILEEKKEIDEEILHPKKSSLKKIPEKLFKIIFFLNIEIPS